MQLPRKVIPTLLTLTPATSGRAERFRGTGGRGNIFAMSAAYGWLTGSDGNPENRVFPMP
jgi:hypothetical protein